MSHPPIGGQPLTIFIPSATVTGRATAAPGSAIALPAVDSNNQQMIVTNNSAGSVTIQPGAAGVVQANAVLVPAGTTILLDDPTFAAATSVAAETSPETGFASITISRGATSASWIFNRAPN